MNIGGIFQAITLSYQAAFLEACLNCDVARAEGELARATAEANAKRQYEEFLEQKRIHDCRLKSNHLQGVWG